jgi:hypothetical protein
MIYITLLTNEIDGAIMYEPRSPLFKKSKKPRRCTVLNCVSDRGGSPKSTLNHCTDKSLTKPPSNVFVMTGDGFCQVDTSTPQPLNEIAKSIEIEVQPWEEAMLEQIEGVYVLLGKSQEMLKESNCEQAKRRSDRMLAMAEVRIMGTIAESLVRIAVALEKQIS